MLKVGLIGLGAIGRVHFDCWRKCAGAQLVAISARDPKKLAGEWAAQEFNLGDQSSDRVDLSGIATYREAGDLIADPNVEAVDICLPTRHHAPLTIAALRAGKHVFCEKPMALTVEECAAMIDAARAADRLLVIGHCLRYWPHYVHVREALTSGVYGSPLHASLFRMSALPKWSADGWLTNPAESGGVILDMHIHDIDIARWWFGEPDRIESNGSARDGLPLSVDALWHYTGGPAVHLHSAWDPNGGDFRHGFTVVFEKATLLYDLASESGALRLRQNGTESTIPLPNPAAHQAEIDDFAAQAVHRTRALRIPPGESLAAVRLAIEELRQVAASL
jgi:predicted dehydrogenase